MSNNKRTVFNRNNQGHNMKHYPLFFGDSLGLSDSVNITHKSINELKEQQRSQSWYPTEVPLIQDKMDMLHSPKGVVDIMTLTIGWQSQQDSIAGRSIGALLLPHVTNPECEAMIAEWCRIEVVHWETYQHIIKQVMPNPDNALLDIYNNEETYERSKPLIKVFDEVYNMPLTLPMEEKKKRMAKLLSTILAMEYISFMASFCVTFAIGETNRFAGVAENVRLICRDEICHSRMSYEVIKAQKKFDGWQGVYDSVKEEVEDILKSIVEGELAWSEYLFSEGRSVVGLTEDLLKDVVLYHANVVYRMLDIKNPFKVIENNPATFMNKWIDSSNVQFAPQELVHGSYRQGAISDDVSDDDDLDFNF